MSSRCFVRPATALAALASFLVVFLAAAAAQAAAPAAPTSLRGSFNSTTSLTLAWDDLTGDETGFEIDYSANGGAQTLLGTFAASGAGSGFNISITPTAGVHYTFFLRAYNGATSNASAFINVAMVPAALTAPTSPLLVTQPDGSLRFMYTDNSTAENGYFIEYATAASTGPFTVLGSTGANTVTVLSGTLNPSTTYYFRARAFQGTATSPTAYSAYSSPVVSLTTSSTLNAPTGLTVTTISPNETSVSVAYTDNTGLNNEYSIEYCLSGTNAFVVLGTAGDVTPITATNAVAPGTAYDFRIRAVYDNGTGNPLYSGYSNTASVTTPFYAPTNLSATTVSDTQVNLSWTENSQADEGASIYYAPSGTGNFTLLTNATAGASTFSATGLTPGTAYDFQVKAAFERNGPGTATVVESAPSNTASATTKDGFTSPAFQPVTDGQAFSYQVTTSSLTTRNSWSVTGLPPGLNFNSTSGSISGTPTQSGLYSVTLSATFASGWTANETLTLRIIQPPTAPVVGTALPSTETFSVGDSAASVSLTGAFSDPDTESAVRLVTTKGNIDVLLYNAETPATVTNFLSYVNGGSYNNSAFHRITSIATDGIAVLQGGELTPSASALDAFTNITTQPNIQNEPGISNLSYTIAMAKQGGNPNSASSQFYFNLSDQDNVLDSVANDGGFTVFGRVSALTQANLTAIANSPTGGPYTINVGGTPENTGFLWPMNVANQASVPATMNNTEIMTIISAAPLTQTLTLTANSSSPSVATAAVSGTNLTITPAAAGAAIITVTATDLDGMTTSQTINVTVNQTLAQWATSQGLSGPQAAATADPDGDGLTNLQEFAFLTSPTAPNTNPTSYALANTGGVSYCQITFPVRKFAANLTYTVEASDTLLAGSWSTIWTSANGFTAPAVVSAVDQSDRTVLTVQDTEASPPATHRFMRVTVSSP